MNEEIQLRVLREAEKISGGKLVSLAMYGSHVAGYARRESDYDFIAIVNGFRDKIKYYYLNLNGSRAALLVVDRESFEKDVENSHLGEFVSGRLCTVFREVHGEGYLSEQEVKMKERIALEELSKIKREFGKLTLHLMIPLRYFLYSKLRERIGYYPPVKYSYVKTFFEVNAQTNTSKSIEGFRKAVERLKKRKLVEVIDDYVRVVDLQGVKAESWVKAASSYCLKVLRSYLAHMRAGRVSPPIFFYELLSKGKRALEKIDFPSDLKRPKRTILLADPETKFNYDKISINDLIKDVLGEKARVLDVKREPSFLATVFKVKAAVNGAEKTYAYKRYTDLGSLKWIPVELYILPTVSFTLLPRNRMINEYFFNKLMKDYGFRVPKVIALNWSSKSMLMEYIDGRQVSEYISNKSIGEENIQLFTYVGRKISEIHARKICLVDTKPQNIIHRGGEVFFTDLEQAKLDGDKAWDIALHIFYGVKFTFDSKWAKKFAEAFIDGYLEKGEREAVRKSVSAKYLRIFLPFTPPNTFKSVVESIKQASS